MVSQKLLYRATALVCFLAALLFSALLYPSIETSQSSLSYAIDSSLHDASTSSPNATYLIPRGEYTECGKDSFPAGKICPLNTCCSQYGYCGSSEEFCGEGCQSMCNLHPIPPGSPSKGISRNRVIGYYQSWADRSLCHQVSPTDLPLHDLTHLNYAFASISPDTFEIVTMDSMTPGYLFQATVGTKIHNPNLQVFVAIGGWTFSNNGTATQPMFSQIASNQLNRQKFADNAVKFLNHYGFDGLDIDWEYPGAPDRGGIPDDTKNFVLLMQTLRTTFNTAPRSLALTFTAPASLWYLRWFDLPELLKYADWTNLMTYDLHGIWDSDTKIGNIVKAHTNLTEIKLAAELLWRVGIMPEQVSLGYGFYGRSFELSDMNCATPGCRFAGGARPGPCSATSGILMYYEIQAILSQVQGLKPVHDKDAAVKYLVFDSNQWVSYDDLDTFKQKVDWADSVGFGGSMIWAIDIDDDRYTAISGLLGKLDVSHPDLEQKPFAPTSPAIAENLVGNNGQDCKVMKDMGCVDPEIVRCPDGQHKVGWDKDGCKSGGKIICCPAKTSPRSCEWRGSGGDCNGQCHVGEATLFKSSWGGGFKAQSDTTRCSRGVKVFCCSAGDWDLVVDGCRWTNCGGTCETGERELAATHDHCSIIKPSKSYCCPNDSALYDCIWRGEPGDCPDAKCMPDEVAIANDHQGNSFQGCRWGRQRTNCCKVAKPPPSPITCEYTICDLDPLGCLVDDSEDSAEPYQDSLQHLEKRARRDVFFAMGLAANAARFVLVPRPYGGPTAFMNNLRRNLLGLTNQYFRRRALDCGATDVGATTLNVNAAAPSRAQIEHPVPLLTPARTLSTMFWGRHWDTSRPPRNESRIPLGPETLYEPLPRQFFDDIRNETILPASLGPATPGSENIRRPIDRLMERLGSTNNPSHFILVEDAVNAAKGLIEDFRSPMAKDKFERHVKNAMNGGGNITNPIPPDRRTPGDGPTVYRTEEESIEAFFAPMNELVGVFDYIRHPITIERIAATVESVYEEFIIWEQHIPSAYTASDHWHEAYEMYFSTVSQFSRDWLRGRIDFVRQQFENSQSSRRDEVFAALKELEKRIPDMKYPHEF